MATSDVKSLKTVRVEFDVDRVTYWLFGISTVIAGLNLLLGFLKFIDHESFLISVLEYFDGAYELTFGSWFSSLLMAFAAVGAFVAAKGDEEFRRGFTWLGWLLLYLSLDEATALHERFNGVGRDQFDIAFFDREWIPFALVALAVVGVLFLRFLFRLPTGVRMSLITGGLVFLAGAIGFELLAGYLHNTQGPGVGSEIATVMEEFAELIGVLIVARALFLVARDGADHVSVRNVVLPRYNEASLADS